MAVTVFIVGGDCASRCMRCSCLLFFFFLYSTLCTLPHMFIAAVHNRACAHPLWCVRHPLQYGASAIENSTVRPPRMRPVKWTSVAA